MNVSSIVLLVVGLIGSTVAFGAIIGIGIHILQKPESRRK